MSIRTFYDSTDINARELIRRSNNVRPRLATVITFGCQQNEADGERIRGVLVDLGFELSDSYLGAELVILNTCAIRAHAEDKVLSLIGKIKSDNRDVDGLMIGVLGCMAAEREVVERLKTRFHYVSFTLEPNSLERLPSLIFDAMECGRRGFALGIDDGGITEEIPVVRSSDFKAWVSVMYGCNNFCSYCIVPYVRGRERSRKSSDVINECRELVRAGIKEITLLGQNVNSYKSDLSFPELLSKVADIEGDFIIRFMTSHPKDVSDGLISVMATHSDKIAPYFHLPLQSGSDKILKSMNRTYDREGFLSTVERLRQAMPDITLSTDVIVGFPGEEEEDFLDTLDILRRVEFDAVYGFAYSERKGTRAPNLDGRVAPETRAERLSRLFAFQDPISVRRNERLLNTEQPVLVTSVKNGVADSTARSGKLVRFEADGARAGEILKVRIVKVNPYELTGKIINYTSEEKKNDKNY